MAEVARRRYGKLIEWAQAPHEYGLEELTEGFEGYEKQVIEIPKDFLRKRLEYSTVH
ncbi:hypothetical protein NW755_008787 [Fusarium falciforme]|uniref:Uncharacterized protein n=1 Tax=Fusarium falciforme TaxID=195108 RepID=A0A9W8R254_9HYPO|nr:hypothetical protein NW755_008787 [Fusarium falciforme]KAJ4249259.1 hypothetical protein NW757_007836 [Fusarium falciforme]